jgi:hypothetical protein
VLAGVVVGLVMLAPTDPLGLGAEISLAVMKNDTVGWIILVCGFMGSLIALFIRTGAVSAFTETVIARVRTKKGGLFTAWVLGIFVFVDDYLNAIAVGAAMRKVTDSFRTSREMLAYVVDSTAAPVSVVIPISTWAVFFGALLVENGVAEEGQGVQAYIAAIPYMFYAWAAIIAVPLVILGVIPTIGPIAQGRGARGDRPNRATRRRTHRGGQSFDQRQGGRARQQRRVHRADGGAGRFHLVFRLRLPQGHLPDPGAVRADDRHSPRPHRGGNLQRRAGRLQNHDRAAGGAGGGLPAGRDQHAHGPPPRDRPISPYAAQVPCPSPCSSRWARCPSPPGPTGVSS